MKDLDIVGRIITVDDLTVLCNGVMIVDVGISTRDRMRAGVRQ